MSCGCLRQKFLVQASNVLQRQGRYELAIAKHLVFRHKIAQGKTDERFGAQLRLNKQRKLLRVFLKVRR